MRLVQYVTALLLTGTAQIFAFDFPDSRSYGMGGTTTLLRPSASAQLSAAVSSGRGWTIDLAGSRRFSLSELDEFSIAVARRAGSVSASIGFAQFGDPDLYCERLLKTGATVSFSQISFGVNRSWLFCSFGSDYGTIGAGAFGLSSGWKIPGFATVLSVDNIEENSLSGGVPIRRTYTLLAELAGKGDYSLLGRVRIVRDSRPQFGFGHVLDILDRASFYWGISSEPLTYGAGIDIMHHGWRLSYAASYHPTLGMTQAVSVALETNQAEQE